MLKLIVDKAMSLIKRLSFSLEVKNVEPSFCVCMPLICEFLSDLFPLLVACHVGLHQVDDGLSRVQLAHVTSQLLPEPKEKLSETLSLRVLRTPLLGKFIEVCFALKKILQKPTDSVPQQDWEYQKLKSGCEN